MCSNSYLYVGDPQRRVWFALRIFGQLVWVVTSDKVTF